MGCSSRSPDSSLTHLVGEVGEQVQDKVSHPLNELLQRLKRRSVQYKLLCLQIDHHLIDIWENTWSMTDVYFLLMSPPFLLTCPTYSLAHLSHLCRCFWHRSRPAGLLDSCPVCLGHVVWAETLRWSWWRSKAVWRGSRRLELPLLWITYTEMPLPPRSALPGPGTYTKHALRHYGKCSSWLYLLRTSGNYSVCSERK